ncbi:unnamed protein product [Blepharisma stoltei]|uniref:RING-type E3 ubiquitin transferase n=1 Tax=Blepharisma stoltei TaxID=1481888 RepID=A0AAU9JXW6_9CILI|nr:unnamed protein product [Blepharisma stoltei]
MVESNVLIVDKQLLESCLQCPICFEYFTIPIYQCDSGHSICDRCSQRTQKCPSCREVIGRKLRNYHLEQQLYQCEYTCQFTGCNEKVKLSARLEHEEECRHNPNYQCLLTNCKWKGQLDSLLSHLNTKHKIPHYDITGNTAEYSSRLRSSSLPPTAGCVKLLHTFYITEDQTCTILTYIFMDSLKNLFYPQFRTLGKIPAKFTLKIWNTDSDENEEIVIAGMAETAKNSLDEEREKKQCIALDLESLINRFAFQDKVERGHKLLHYRLTIEMKEN